MGDTIDSNGQPVHDSIAIISGKGLFSSSVMSFCHLADASLDLATLKFAQPTTYEIEYIARAAPAIAVLACTMLLNNKAANITTPLSINLDIPNWHYYKAVEEKLQKGLCTANDALLYFEAITRRYDQLSSVFMTGILHECALRGETNPIINVAPKLNVVADCIKSALMKKTRPSFMKVMQALDEEEDGIWRQFYRLVPAKECPRDFEELGYLLYVLQVVKPAFRAQAPS